MPAWTPASADAEHRPPGPAGDAFTNAHCQAPLCNPSRSSLLTGLRPSTTGIYALEPGIRAVPSLKDTVTLPQYFAAHGYWTATLRQGFSRRLDRAG